MSYERKRSVHSTWGYNYYFTFRIQSLHVERVVLVTKISLQTLRIFIFQTDRHAAQAEELSNTIRQNQLQIDELSRELSESKSQATQLHREVEAKGQEILNVRREANNHIR